MNAPFLYLFRYSEPGQIANSSFFPQALFVTTNTYTLSPYNYDMCLLLQTLLYNMLGFKWLKRVILQCVDYLSGGDYLSRLSIRSYQIHREMITWLLTIGLEIVDTTVQYVKWKIVLWPDVAYSKIAHSQDKLVLYTFNEVSPHLSLLFVGYHGRHAVHSCCGWKWSWDSLSIQMLIINTEPFRCLSKLFCVTSGHPHDQRLQHSPQYSMKTEWLDVNQSIALFFEVIECWR